MAPRSSVSEYSCLYTVCRSPFSVQPESPRHPCYTRNCLVIRTPFTNFPHIERTDCRTGFHTGCIARSSRTTKHYRYDRSCHPPTSGSFPGSMAPGSCWKTSKVFCTNNVATDFELPTFSCHTTDILHLAALRIRWLRDLHTEQEVILTPIVVRTCHWRPSKRK